MAKVEKKPGRITKINWLDAKKDYISDSSFSYKKIAEKYGVAENTVLQRAKKEGWVELRRNIMEKAEDQIVDVMSKEIAEIETRHKSIYRNAEVMHVNILSAYNEYITDEITKAKKANKPVDPKKLISPFWLNQLTDSLTKTTNMTRIMYNLPTTSVTRVEGKMAVATIEITADKWKEMNDTDRIADQIIEGNSAGVSA